jgi:UDP-N-acetylglucosamine--N-acetylmuramyl-(pentapeptide) pyrophosphoryl-undecaprenol N-acetylglucosamine transferase
VISDGIISIVAKLEQPETPDWIRAMTHYAGGLCTAQDVVPGKAEARAMLGLSPDREIVVVLTGGGGAGTPYAPLTMAARAARDRLAGARPRPARGP